MGDAKTRDKAEEFIDSRGWDLVEIEQEEQKLPAQVKKAPGAKSTFTLFLKNIPPQIEQEETLLEYLRPFGIKILDCRIVRDRQTGQSKSIAFIDVKDE